MPPSVPSPSQALYWFNCSPLLLLRLFGPIPHSRASLFLIKLLWKHGKSRWGRSCGEAFVRQSKILHCYSTLWLGGLRCQYRRQTIWLLAVPAWWQKIKSLSAPKVHRFTGEVSGMPDYQSSPRPTCCMPVCVLTGMLPRNILRESVMCPLNISR